MTLSNRFDMGESSPVKVRVSFTKTIWTPRSVYIDLQATGFLA
jgi:hypothetical protein